MEKPIGRFIKDPGTLSPVLLNLHQRRVHIFGGGQKALNSLKGFLASEAEIIVQAPTISEEVRACRGIFPDIRHIKFIERDYQQGDEEEAFLVVAAMEIKELNRQISNRCRDQMILVSDVDCPETSDFLVPV
jgi:siroheme synthase-like protein